MPRPGGSIYFWPVWADTPPCATVAQKASSRNKKWSVLGLFCTSTRRLFSCTIPIFSKNCMSHLHYENRALSFHLKKTLWKSLLFEELNWKVELSTYDYDSRFNPKKVRTEKRFMWRHNHHKLELKHATKNIRYCTNIWYYANFRWSRYIASIL